MAVETPLPEDTSFLRPIDKAAVAALGLPWFEIEPQEAEIILHGKPLQPVLEGKKLFSRQEILADSGQTFSAAVFSGETLAAVVEKSGGVWKYGCVFGN
jgi:hypothetical protein